MTLSIRDLTARYKGAEHPVIAGVSGSTRGGRVLGILGPNGSGKTSLLRCITGALPIESGSVDIDGQDVRTLSARRLSRRIALIPQISAMQYELTVQDVVLMGRNPHLKRFERTSARDMETVRAALSWVDLLPLSQRSVLTLSGGEWQRMIIARALAQQSGILLMDEPTTGLDIKHQAQILLLIQKLARERGVCVLCVLHDINAAARFSDEIWLMDHGKITAQGPPADVITAQNIQSVYGCAVRVQSADGVPEVHVQYHLSAPADAFGIAAQE